MRRIQLGWLACLACAMWALVSPAPATGQAADWGGIDFEFTDGKWSVVFENSKIRVRYGRKDFGDIVEDLIVEFVIKPTGENQAGRYIEEVGYGAHEGRGLLTQVSLIYEAPEKKTAWLEWDDGKCIQKISIYKDAPFLEIQYIRYGINLVDIGSPGGSDEGVYEIYGADEWRRGYLRYPQIYFSKYEPDIGYENITEVEDPGPLSYKGWFILGVYNPDNGRGFGRVVPVDQIDIIKLLHGTGFELFTCFGQPKEEFRGYIFAVENGASEIIEMGKELADGWKPQQ